MCRSLAPFVFVFVFVPAVSERVAFGGDDPSPVAVHAAIDRGADWLRARHAGGFEDRTFHDPVELVVLTLHHAGSNLSDETYKKGLAILETSELRFTYRVSVLAMTLAELNPRMYADRLAHCAQWLVDTQLPAGEWGYPGTIQGPDKQPHAVAIAPPSIPEDAAEGAQPQVVRRTDPATMAGLKGDFSNTQFAVLGLRACRDAGVEIPKETWQDALAFMVRTQRKDGGWGYHYAGEQDEASYASLTCAGLCGAAICLHALGKSPASHPAVRKAKLWLKKRFDARRNFGIDRSAVLIPTTWQYYHLYSVERVGRVLGWKEIGKTAWYPAGARFILGAQRPDGSWEDPAGWDFGNRPLYLTTADTCFAILFLARATPPLTGR